jgi:hypothetical protein
MLPCAFPFVFPIEAASVAAFAVFLAILHALLIAASRASVQRQFVRFALECSFASPPVG